MADIEVDVLIVGAGLSGIGAAAHLQKRCPGKTYAILEARAEIGGTWDLFRYPGVRSDSDMFTLGYAFKPWKQQKAIADGPSILAYVKETAQEYGIARHIRFKTRALTANWNTQQACWTVAAESPEGAQTYRCRFLLLCSGYYRYSSGHTPDFPGLEAFKGRIVHPQHWPEDLDYTGQDVVVIGSGATAVTLVPAMAATAKSVTMLQRSPTFMFSMPSEDSLANLGRRLLPEKLAYGLTRWRKILMQIFTFTLARKQPQKVKEKLIQHVQERLPEGVDIARDFTPRYNPWDQRLCLVPDDDLFSAIAKGKARVVTGSIQRFTSDGVELTLGQTLKADLIVTATGLSLLAAGGVSLSVDGDPVRLGERFAYKGLMISDLPNCAFIFGYTNASWTLRADLISGFVCRLINHMDAHGYASATPRPADPHMPAEPFLDFSSGYVIRAMDQFPKQGPTAPWRHPQNYIQDLFLMRYGRLEDGVLAFEAATLAPSAAASQAAAALTTAE
ncbi:MAG: NAD(P)/FAD-dependent oxidoreductase [Alphaproteobacteria bacterium]|nr:NAD(P)/FAD-dependent oxidoreductase [Alphaproteobacteria bacterium]